MTTLLQQLGRTYEQGCASSADSDRAAGNKVQNHLLQQRDKHREREREREQLHQLQSISNLLLDLPPIHSSSYLSGNTCEGSRLHTSKGSITDGDMSISDLFGLGLPRGSLMSTTSQASAVGSSVHRGHQSHPQHQQYQTPSLHNQTAHHTHQYDDGHGCWPNTSTLDTPGSPNCVSTPGSPSTPGSMYSNPYSYTTATTNSAPGTPSSSSNRVPFMQMGSPSSSIRSQYCGRPIRGSPSYSDCGSPTLECTPMIGYHGSRSNSPADSETSGVSSMDGSLSDIMNCLSMNSGSHPCSQQTLGSLMSPDTNLCPGNRAAAFQRMANKKYLSSTHQQQPQLQSALHYHYSNNHIRNHQYPLSQTGNYLNSLLNTEKNCCSGGNAHMLLYPGSNNLLEQQTSLDRAARFHRNAAALYDATCTWSGLLPQRTQKPSGYSSKVFLGGVPWDITESLLITTFKQFGQIRVEWPGKEQSVTQPRGYVYIIFESEKQVIALLSCCTHDFTNGGSWFYKISSKRMKAKEVQVIPWALDDSDFVKPTSQKLDPQRTVFVGALHGMLTAEGLAKIMNDLFKGVIYAGIDTDKYKYPIGSARVTFSSNHSYMKAVTAAFIEIKTAKFTKKVQIDPYLEDSLCSGCSVQQGPYFCRELVCFRYFCRSCWHWQHAMESMRHHEPMMRSSKANQVIGLSPGVGTYNNGYRASNRPTI